MGAMNLPSLLLAVLLVVLPCAPAFAEAPIVPPADPPFVDWFGRSGHLRAVFTRTGAATRALPAGLLTARQLKYAARSAGAYVLKVRAPDGAPLTLFTLVPFEAKRGSRLGGYKMGRWPQETKAGSANGYVKPEGFIRVTRWGADAKVSTRFRLRDFLTHDQADVWPKYLVLRAPLVDKLELVADALVAAGRSDSIKIMSGFRTPAYNEPGVGAGGRAGDSRHIYGDAADIFVDADGDSAMDDLDGDGKVTIEDARWLAALVEGIEADHPDLVGGLSAYPATDEHGPFVHVDVRGRAARW
jgi:hypothetical protein